MTLLGLISKHGILIVQFANELQRAGRAKLRGDRGGRRGAVAAHPDDHRGDGARRRAAGHRLRRGRRRTARNGYRAVHGLSIGTLFTLFIVPAVYMLLGADHGHDRQPRPTLSALPDG